MKLWWQSKLFALHRYQPPKKKVQEECKIIIERFKQHQIYDKAYREILSLELTRSTLIDKDQRQQNIIRDHVRETYFFLICNSRHTLMDMQQTTWKFCGERRNNELFFFATGFFYRCVNMWERDNVCDFQFVRQL